MSYSDPTGQYGEAAFLGIAIWTWVAIAASAAIVILASQALVNDYQNSLADQAPVPLPTNTGSGTTAINDGPSPEWRDSGFGPPNSQPLLTTNGGGYNLWDSFSEGFKGSFSGFKTLFTDPLSLIRPLSFGEALQETMGMLMPGTKVMFAQQRANAALSRGDAAGYAEIQGGLFGDVVLDGLSLVPVGRLAKFAKFGRAARGGLSTTQLVQKSATLAERAVGGTGRFAGTAKHTYANNLLSRYQSIHGSRGLQFNNGVGNRGFLDVVNHGSRKIYDFKFGSANWGRGQLQKYQRNFPGYSIQIIRP